MRKKLIAAVTGLMIIAMSATTTLATNLTIDGVKVTPVDSKGNKVEIINIDGTTYLPVRFFSEKAGYTVEWDGETSTVNIYAPKSGLVESVNGLAARVYIMGTVRTLNNYILNTYNGALINLNVKSGKVVGKNSNYWGIQTEKEYILLDEKYCNSVYATDLNVNVFYYDGEIVGADLKRL